MSEATPTLPQGPRAKTLYHLALIGAIVGSYVTGQELNVRVPDPAGIARVEALAVRVEALEQKASDPHPAREAAALAAHVAALRAQLDILMRRVEETPRGRR